MTVGFKGAFGFSGTSNDSSEATGAGADRVAVPFAPNRCDGSRVLRSCSTATDARIFAFRPSPSSASPKIFRSAMYCEMRPALTPT